MAGSLTTIMDLLGTPASTQERIPKDDMRYPVGASQIISAHLAASQTFSSGPPRPFLAPISAIWHRFWPNLDLPDNFWQTISGQVRFQVPVGAGAGFRSPAPTLPSAPLGRYLQFTGPCKPGAVFTRAESMLSM